MIRAFVALEIPPGLRHRLREEQRRLREVLPRAKWVRPEGIHLTLKFLGDIERAALDDLASELAPALCGLGKIQVALSGSGFFPSSRRARVAWIGGQAEGVAEVVTVIETIAARHGSALEKRPWSLHLTMARLRDSWPSHAVEQYLQWGQGLELEVFECCDVVLFESSLRPEGAQYTVLHRLPLR